MRRGHMLVAIGLATAASVAAATPVFAQSVTIAPASLDAGAVTLVAGPGSSHALSAGGSNTNFSLKLPAGAACPGDSANDNYRLQSFFVPAATNLDVLRYKFMGPDTSPGDPLIDLGTHPYTQRLTDPNQTPGLPGRIPVLPDFSFVAYTPGYYAPGRYHIGVACTLYNVTKRYWVTDVVVVAAPADKPAGIRWSHADRTANPSSSSPSSSHLALVLGVIGGAVLAVVVVILRLRTPRVASH
jgi:hypothetical protein